MLYNGLVEREEGAEIHEKSVASVWIQKLDSGDQK